MPIPKNAEGNLQWRNRQSFAHRKKIEYFINENGCHICTSHKSSTNPYPKITIHGKKKLISRLIYEEKTELRIPDKMEICHTCDTPQCINYNHFFLGTHADNMRDCNNKKRRSFAKGENHGNAKFKNSDIPVIRSDQRAASEIAKDYGVGASAIQKIKNRTWWKHI